MMNKFQISLFLENEFDSLNRVLNIFCGKGIEFNSLNTISNKEKKCSELFLEVKGPKDLLTILLKKISLFPDVHKVTWKKEPHFINNEGLYRNIKLKGDKNEIVL
tara:strand:+ start:253 stop:567 length:315 start_codon:yes stop_codon:yes gene_type:complete